MVSSNHLLSGDTYGNATIYCGNGGDTVTGGSGNNEVYGGNGTGKLDNINVSAGQNNWVQAGSGGATITGGSGHDWLYGGAGTNTIHGGDGTEVIHGGNGVNYLYGGSGLDDIFGGGDGSHNYIFGRGSHDRLVGGSGGNYIVPADAVSPPPPGAGLASIEVKDSINQPTFDGSINENGVAYYGDSRAIETGDGTGGPPQYTFNGYGGYDWTFDDLGSGDRLGGSATETPVAVYVTWNVFGLHLTSSQWADYATYNVYDVVPNGGGTKLLTTGLPGSLGGPLVVNQGTTAPGGASPVGTDRPWSLLGVWNVPVGHTVKVELTDGNGQPNRYLCIGDAMIHPIWPTVSLRLADVTPAHGGDFIDWATACTSFQIPEEGVGNRVPLQITTSIEPLYYDISGSTTGDWQAILPLVVGTEFWSAASGGTPLVPDGSGKFVLLTSASTDGVSVSTVYASINPDGPLASNWLDDSQIAGDLQSVAQIVAGAAGPNGAAPVSWDKIDEVCFAAGTPILMADGTTKCIETIQRGDKVRAAFHDAPEGTISDGEVVEVYHNGPRKLIEVEVDGQIIRVTPKHPFYVRGRGWTAAAELRVGDMLRTASGDWIAAGPVVENGDIEPVFNFTVAGLHTYFVRNGSGNACVLVHNASSVDYRKLFMDATPSMPKDWEVHHIGQQQKTLAKRFNDELGINVHSLDNLRAVPPKIHYEITDLQNKWWANQVKLHPEYGDVQGAYRKVPLSEVKAFNALIEPDYKGLWIPARAGAADVAAIKKELANLKTMTVGKAQRMNSVLKKSGIALGALAVFGLAWENANLAKNILDPPQYVQAAFSNFLNSYERCYEEALQSNGVNRLAWGRMTDALSEYMTVAGFDGTVKNGIIHGFMIEELYLR